MGLQSLYDNYRLNNSTQIPQYLGSTGDAAIKVATMRQGMYDTAQTTAGELGSMSQNALAMDVDNGLKNELVSKVQGKIGEWSGRGDWENNVEAVRGLGREYVQRAKELAAPVEQYQSWVKEELTDEKKGLNPSQIQALQAKRLAEYRGLKKDQTGKFIGGFSGGQVAKNIDEKKFADDALQGYVIQQGGTEVANDNGIMRYKTASGWKVMTPARIKDILKNARELSSDYKGYAAQEGEIESFVRGRDYSGIKDVNEIKDPQLKANVEKVMNQGYSVEEAVPITLGKIREFSIANTMDNYAVGKYQQNDRTSSSESAVGAVTVSRMIKADEDKANINTSIISDTLGNPALNYTDLDKNGKESGTQRTTAATSIEREKNRIAAALGKPLNQLKESDIAAYYAKDPVSGATQYAQLQSYRSQMQTATESMRKVEEAKQVVENQTYQALGYDRNTFQTRLRGNLTSNISDSGTVSVEVNGVVQKMKASDLKAAISNGTIESKTLTVQSGGAGAAAGGGATKQVPMVTIRGADGKVITLTENGFDQTSNMLRNAIKATHSSGKEFETKRDELATTMLKNYSQTMGVLVTNNPKVNMLMTQSLQAGEKTIYDANDQPIKPGTDEDNEVKSMIEAGKFKFIGTFTESKGKGQGTYTKISVGDPEDPKAIPKTYRVNLTKMNTEGLADFYKKSSLNDDGTVDPDLYAASAALKPGSGYNKITKTNLGTVADIKQKVPKKGGGFEWVSVGKVKKDNIDGLPSVLMVDANNQAIQSPIQQNQLQIGAYLDRIAKDPNYRIDY